MIKNMRAIPPWELKNNQQQTQGPSLLRENSESTKLGKVEDSELFKDFNKAVNKGPRPTGPLLPSNPGLKPHGPVVAPPFLKKLPEKEIEKRLKAVEKNTESKDLVEKVGDQYQYTKDFVYLAYASALSNLSNNKITNQSDATDFQFSPFSSSGTLMPYRGFFTNKSIYQSGDPTDYTWQSTSGMVGYTASERYYSVSTKRLEELGNPTKPGTGVTWTAINSGSGIPGSAIWFAERFNINSVWANWSITAVGPWVGSDFLVDGAIIEAKIAANAITTAKILNDAIDNDKIAANAVNTDQIAADAIVANKILAGEIGANHIAANAITAGKINTDAVTAGTIAAGAVTAVKIDTDAVTANKIAAGTITGNKISSSTAITAGSGTDVAALDGADSTYRIYAGHSTPASAPFRVKKDGTVIIDSGGTSKLVLEDDVIKVFNNNVLRVKLGNLS